MKRFLSAVLALIMLIAPMGAASCFADGGKYNKLFFDTMRELKLGKTRSIVVLMEDGRYFSEVDLFGEDGSYIGTQESTEQSYRILGPTLIEFGFQELIRFLGCSKAHLICDNDVKGFYSVVINFYNSDGTIVKTIKKDGYQAEFVPIR